MFAPELAASALLLARARIPIPIPIFEGHFCLSVGVAILIITVLSILKAAFEADSKQLMASTQRPERGFRLDTETAAERKASMDQQLFRVLKRVMVFLMLADEAVDEAEVAAIQRVYRQFTRQDLARAEIDREIELVRSAGPNALEEAIVFSNHLADEGKELLLRAAIIVVGADGVCGPEERERLVELACSLGILPEAFNRVWSSMVEVREPES